MKRSEKKLKMLEVLAQNATSLDPQTASQLLGRLDDRYSKLKGYEGPIATIAERIFKQAGKFPEGKKENIQFRAALIAARAHYLNGNRIMVKAYTKHMQLMILNDDERANNDEKTLLRLPEYITDAAADLGIGRREEDPAPMSPAEAIEMLGKL